MQARKIAAEAGWVVLTFNFRGTGTSEGDFSLDGWLAGRAFNEPAEVIGLRKDETLIGECTPEPAVDACQKPRA